MHKYNTYIKYFLLVLTFGFVVLKQTFANTLPSGFIVEVNPSNFAVNQAVDITIKAVDANGNIMNNYDGFAFIDIIPSVGNTTLSYDDFVVPSEGLIVFEPNNLGKKTFSKGLIIKKPGTYTIKVYELDNENISGQKEVIVGSNQQTQTSSITVTSPIAGSIETMALVTVVAQATNLINSPYQIEVNGIIVATGTTTAQGTINTTISNLQSGSNTLQIKILDANNIVLGQSDPITFIYKPVTDDWLYGIQILPNTQAKQGDKIIISVDTNTMIGSAEILLGTGTTIPLDKDSPGKFVKQILLEPKGNVPIGLRLYNQGNTKLYQNIAILSIQENNAIGLIKFFTDSMDKTKITITRQIIGQINRFRINYGTNKDSLNQETVVDTNQVEISGLDPAQIYYFQITPIDQNNNIIGTPSDIQEINPALLQAQNCLVDGIQIRTEQIDNKYYLVRDPVENAQKYIIYRSDTMTSVLSEMRKVGETTDTRFEYPFDKKALSQEFAYYAVVAVCASGKEILIDQIKKVEVGPYDSIILGSIIALLLYTIRKLHKNSSTT